MTGEHIRFITVPARELHSGDFINGRRVTRLDADTNPGRVYVHCDDDLTPYGAVTVYSHGDPVRIERADAERRELEADLDAAERAANGPGASGILYRRAEACITCDTPLTADDPAVTTLGPRCRRHF